MANKKFGKLSFGASENGVNFRWGENGETKQFNLGPLNKLFAGSGALSLEAISRGASSAVMVDHDRKAIQCIKKNVETLRFTDSARVMQSDWKAAVETLRREDRKFDLVFLDPPYAMVELAEVTEAIRPLLSENALVVIEHDVRTMPHVADGYDATDTRKYGIVGITFFRDVTQDEE